MRSLWHTETDIRHPHGVDSFTLGTRHEPIRRPVHRATSVGLETKTTRSLALAAMRIAQAALRAPSGARIGCADILVTDGGASFAAILRCETQDPGLLKTHCVHAREGIVSPLHDRLRVVDTTCEQARGPLFWRQGETWPFPLPETEILPETCSALWSCGLVGTDGSVLGIMFLAFDGDTSTPRDRALIEECANVVTSVVERRGLAASGDDPTFWHSLSNMRATIERLGEGIIVADIHNRIVFTNRAITDLVGYTQGELAGEVTSMLIPESAWPDLSALRARPGLNSDERHEVEIRHKSGELIWVEIKAIVLDGSDGEVEGTLGVLTDVRERKQSELSVRKSERRFRSMFESAPMGIALVDPRGNISRANGRLRAMLTSEEGDLDGHALVSLFDGRSGGPIARQLPTLLSGETESYRGEVRLLSDPTKPVWANVTLSAVHDEGGAASFLIAMFEDITEQKSNEDRLHYLAQYSPLTDLPNRVLFVDILDQTRLHTPVLAVVVIDVDRFKVLTHTLGRERADRMLRAVGQRLKSEMRPGDVLAHFGGDQFALLLLDIEDSRTAIEESQRILALLDTPVLIDNFELVVSASLGIGVYPHHGRNPQNLIKHAQTAMYVAKEPGKSSVQLYAAEMTVSANERFSIEGDLRKGLDRGEFVVHYQPLVADETDQIVGVEALVRWHHPVLGLVAPANFIPVAEESGLIVPLGEWVLRTACKQIQQWRTQGFELSVAVNLSAGQFHQKNLASTAATILREVGLESASLELEITENTLMQDFGHAQRNLDELKKIGVKLSIDDFGTGYSSLSYLKRFPIDTLKIDRSFVQDLVNDPNDEAIVTAIIAMAHSLNISVVAEGVELEDQRSCLRSLACDRLQGFLFSPALAADEFTTLLESKASFRARP